MMLFIKLLHQELYGNHRTTNLGKLLPKFHLVGSIAEATRIHKATELDFMCQFKALRNRFPMKALDATTLYAEINHPLREFCNQDGIFSFAAFLQAMLENVQLCLEAIEDELPPNLTLCKVQNLCSQCQSNQSTLQPFMHCPKCLFGVTHTKVGPCIVMKWKQDIVTIDLVPVFPIQVENCTNIADVFNFVTKSLLEKKPPNWLKHLKGIIRSERILPEAFEEVLNESSSNFEMGLKLLHYESIQNYIIRPAQMLNVVDFSDYPREIRDIYIMLKYLKEALNINIKSYLLKKIVLRKEFVSSVAQDGNALSLFYNVLHYPIIKEAFQHKVDYDNWSREGISLVPLRYGQDNVMDKTYIAAQGFIIVSIFLLISVCLIALDSANMSQVK